MSSSTIIDTTIQGQQNVPTIGLQHTQNLPSTGQSVIEDEANIATDAVLIDLSESMNETTFTKEVKN